MYSAILALIASAIAFGCFVLAARVFYEDYVRGGRWRVSVTKQMRSGCTTNVGFAAYRRGSYGVAVALQWVALAVFICDVFAIAGAMK